MGPSSLLLSKPVIAAVSGAAVAGSAAGQVPQRTLRADRMNAYQQWDLSLAEALHLGSSPAQAPQVRDDVYFFGIGRGLPASSMAT
jgi:hypothetical protein